jgi:hypothetical protein
LFGKINLQRYYFKLNDKHKNFIIKFSLNIQVVIILSKFVKFLSNIKLLMNYKLISLFVFIILSSCSTKKDGFVNRFYHNKVGWFNSLFNGNEAFKKAYNEGKKSHKDKYYEVLKVNPVSPQKNEALSFESFDTGPEFSNSSNQGTSNLSGLQKAEEKAITTIKHHSMKIDGVERNKLMAQAYTLLGKSRYYNGEYIESLEAFNHVVNNLKNSRKKFVQESEIYVALSNHELDNDDVSEEIYKSLLTKKLKKSNKKLVSKHYAQFLIDQHRWQDASEALKVAYKKNKSERDRIAFISGQVYEKLKDIENARKYYHLASKKSFKPEMISKSNIALAELFDSTQVDFKTEFQRMKKLSKKGIYMDQKNEMIYALGILHEKYFKPTEAENYYKLALKEKESDVNLRGMNYLKLAKIYFNRSNYVHSGKYYDSANTKIEDPKIKEFVSKTNTNMQQIIKNYYIVKKNDSILEVYAKTPEQRKEYFTNYINKLKVEEEEKRKKEEAKQRYSNDDFGSFFQNNTTQDNSKFQLYNQTAKNKGQVEFRKIWGDRQLSDNWRISQVFTNETAQSIENKLLGKDDSKTSRRFEVEYYLEKLPKTQKEIDSIKYVRDFAELDLGIDYFDKFQDKKLANETLTHLLNSPVKNEDLKLKTYFNLYKINQENDVSTSEIYKNKVINEFPNSKYAKTILNPPSKRNLEKSSIAISTYDKVFELYKNKKYLEVKNEINSQLINYQNDVLAPKFILLYAYSVGKLQEKQEVINSLEKIIKEYPDTKEAVKATDILKKLVNKVVENKEPIHQQNIQQENQTLPENKTKNIVPEDEFPF